MSAYKSARGLAACICRPPSRSHHAPRSSACAASRSLSSSPSSSVASSAPSEALSATDSPLSPLAEATLTGKTETNAVRTMDRLASALRAKRAGDAKTKLSRLRGGGFWADRHLHAPDLAALPNRSAAGPAVDLPKERRMADSYIEVELPFESDPGLLESYIGAFTSVRVGRIMEDLDSLAGSIAWKHVLPDGSSASDAASSGLYIVTAAVDRLDMLRPLSHSLTDPEDLRLSGHVYSTGNSTLEITVRLQSVSRSRGLADTPETILMGRFTMACRSKETGRAHPVPKLITQSPDEQRLESLGKEQKQKKMLALKQSLQTNPPNEEESRMIHNVFTKFADWYKPGAHVPEEVVWMKKGTQLSSVLMCHPQERNVHGNVFGGYLMRLAYEAAYSTGCLFARSPITFLSLDELAFKAPVVVGSLLQLTSAVTFSPIQNYQQHKSFQVSVEAATIDLHTGEKTSTNTFHYTFASSEPMKRYVLPEDYSDGVRWLESMRKKEVGRSLRKLYGISASPTEVRQ